VLLQKYSESTCAEGNMLDIGSGTGYLTKKLVNAYPLNTLFALDIAESMLRTSMETISERAVGYVCADAELLPVANRAVSTIFSNLAFQWSTDLDALFSESYRVLDHEGAIAFSSFGPKTLCELNQAWESADDHVHVNSFVSAQEIQQQLESAGFEQVHVEYGDLIFHYPTVQQLMKDLKGMGAHNISEQRKKGLMGVTAFKRMLKAYEKLRQPQGLPATFQAIYGFARKPLA